MKKPNELIVACAPKLVALLFTYSPSSLLRVVILVLGHSRQTTARPTQQRLDARSLQLMMLCNPTRRRRL
jgi:hypothetical protein